MTVESAISIRELSFRYRDREELALQDINLEVKPGELLLVAGVSGCGKTTLIRCLNGLVPRSYKGELTGQIRLQGQDIADLSLARISQLVGTVLQDPERQILNAQVLNEVAFGLENLGLKREEIRSRSLEALDYLHIADLSERQTFSLSGGEKQKVALAGVLAMRPGVLLLDEPLASLDPASAQETLAQVRQLVDQGLTVLLVEHRVEDVLAIHPDRILYLVEGEIRYLGDPEGLYKVVDYREVKLPAEVIMERAAQDPPPGAIEFLPGATGRDGEGEPPLVSFRDVSFGYTEDQSVLERVNLDIRRGEVVAVLGANGAGKTTLVKHAIGLLKPREGRVLVNGRDTRELSVAQIAGTLGYVFQSPSHMLFAPTVREELSFGPKNMGHAPEEIEKEVREAIELVNLKGLEEDPPLALSFGQQKRVSIAAILSMHSRILVMDEPSAGQDYKNYRNFMDAILELPGFEAILFITHDIDLAVVYATRVLLVSEGCVAADGPPEEVLSDFELLVGSRLVPTSLLKANVARLPDTGRFMRAEVLAHLNHH